MIFDTEPVGESPIYRRFFIEVDRGIMQVVLRRLVAALLVVCGVGALLVGTASAAVPGTTTGLAAVAGNTQVALSWTAVSVSPSVTTYNVEYSPDGGVTYALAVRAASTTAAYTVTGLTNDTTYLFRVSAVNNEATGTVSTSVTSTPFVIHTPNDLPLFSACPSGVIPAAGFSDTVSTDVDCIAYYGITKGTTATTYSPEDTVTRWQMALFLTRMASRTGVTLTDGSDQGFADISGKSEEIKTAINQIKQLGITVGKTATTYAPDDIVTREEMVLFLTRLLKKSTVGPGGNEEFATGGEGPKVITSLDADHNFTDLSTVTLYESVAGIAAAWNLGLPEVSARTTFEPSLPMTRKAMATFMTNSLAHTNARPKGLVLQSSGYRVSGTPTLDFSVTHRNDAFALIANSAVDVFKFNHSIVATTVRFDTAGKCSSTISVAAFALSSVKCTVDTGDPKTDAKGNLAFVDVPLAVAKVDYWAWTATPSVVYDNDIDAAGASKITVETTS
jgi:hypothetical protein